MIATTLLFISATAHSFSTDWSTEFDYNTYIDENQLFKLYWTDLPNDVIEFGIEVSATGWIALGISPRGQMPNSDIAIGWVDDDGNAYLQDRYTTGRSAPLYDETQSLTLIEGEEVDGMTRLRWRRDKYSCEGDDMSISQGTTRLIWAFHATADPVEECFDSSSITFHTNMGTQSLNLDSGVPEEVILEDNVETFELLMDEVAVPSVDTTYYCKLFQLPVFEETQYAVKFETVVEEGNEATVHHLVAYYCDSWVAESDHDVIEGDCDDYSLNMPSLQCRGSRIMYVWAVGGNDLYMPEVAAMPLSGGSDLHYVLLEMHYDNPLEKEGIIDSSGIKVYYTPTARQYDASTLQIGLDISILGQWIPGGLYGAHNAAFLPNYCSEDEDAFPEDGIKVFGSFLHQHTIGKAAMFRHIRDGVEQEPIDINLAYDFNYQQTIIFEDPIVLLPGDSFIVDCWTDSSNRTFHTTGGESSSQEMCMVFLFYYPAMPLISATGGKTPDTLQTWLHDAQTAGYLSGTNDEITTIFEDAPYWGAYDFSPFEYYSEKDGALEFYNRLWNTSYDEYNSHYLVCSTQDGWINNNSWYAIPRDESFQHYEITDLECENMITADDVGVCGTVSDESTTTDAPISNASRFMLITSGVLVLITSIFCV